MAGYYARRLMHPYVPRPDAEAVNEDDIYCESCGYNLRGLAPGRACPECGHGEKAAKSAKRGKRRPLVDPLLAGDDHSRHRFRSGLCAIAVLFALVAVARPIAFGGIVLTPDPIWSIGYRWLFFFAALGWVIAVWVVTPANLDALLPKWRRIRQSARLLALAWLPGAAIFLAVPVFLQDDLLLMAGRICRVAGGIGVLVLGTLLYRLAEDAELEQDKSRINLAIWMLPLPTLLLSVVPGTMAWFAVIPLVLVYVVWVWAMLLFAAGSFGMSQHVRWAMRHGLERMGRDERIRARKQKLEEEAASGVRETRRGEGDIPLA